MKKLALITLLGLTMLGPAQAQTDPGSGGPVPGNPPADPTAVPLDGGAGLLLVGGAAYMLKALRRRR